MDNTYFYESLMSHQELIFVSYPTYIGNSSLEVQIDVYQAERLKASCKFVLVLRQAADSAKPYLLPRIEFVGEFDAERAEVRFARGARNQIARKAKAQSPRTWPTSEEIVKGRQLLANTDM